VNIGVQLDRADAENGQLWFLPGSHRHAGPLGDPTATGYPTVAVTAEPGDVTVHYGHVLHAAPPPAGRNAGRRAIYVGFAAPALFDAIGEGQAYNDVLFGDGGGRVRNVAERSAS
jgi:ectoine hydroxylase-related dioxygenase (phytanoyl-CoA dioxygenase family)